MAGGGWKSSRGDQQQGRRLDAQRDQIGFLRSYSIEDLERIIEYRLGGEHYLDVFKAIANEKHGGKLYDVPDGATLTDAEADLARTRLPGLLRWKPGERLPRAPYRILYVLRPRSRMRELRMSGSVGAAGE
jgi:hypothetical protein